MALSFRNLRPLPLRLLAKIWSKLKTLVSSVWGHRKWLNYSDAHFLYIQAWMWTGWAVFAVPGNMSTIDALLFSASGVTVTGFNPVDVSKLKLGQQIWMYVQVKATSSVGIALLTTLKRVRDLRKHHLAFVGMEDKVGTGSSNSGSASSAGNTNPREQAQASDDTPAHSNGGDEPEEHTSAIPLVPTTRFQLSTASQSTTGPSTGLGLRQFMTLEQRIKAKEFGREGQVARHGQFEGLNEHGRLYVLDGEYYSNIFLVVLAAVYWIVIEGACTVAYIKIMHSLGQSLHLQNGTNIVWIAVFHSGSAFHNFGIFLIDAGMSLFKHSIAWLLVSTFQQLAGNMMSSPFLRWTIRLLRRPQDVKYLRRIHDNAVGSEEVLDFILEYPRRCSIYLFPAKETFCLTGMTLFLIALDMIGVEVCKDRDESLKVMSLGKRIVVGLSHSLSVRNAGFTVVPLLMLNFPFQCVLLLTMFIVAYPVTVIMRNTNLYLERGLGIYKEDINYEDQMKKRDRRSLLRWLARRYSEGLEEEYVFLRAQLRHLVARDILVVVLASFVIVFIEWYRPAATGNDFGVFEGFMIVNEVFSGYGNVGMSFGLAGTAASLCAGWHWSCKLVLVWVMVMGRRRGLPMALDHAQPSVVEVVVDSAEDNFEEMEAEERQRRLSHAQSANAEAEAGTA